MQISQMLFIMLGVSAARANSVVTKDTPVTKVVELIQELKAKIEADGKAEQKVYDKFACWCEKTTARKAGAIEEAKASIEELSEKVLNLKGKTATMKAEIAQLEKDIQGNIDGANEATGIREKETADYETQRSDLEQAIGALERAITILTGAGEKTASALQQAEILSVAGGVRQALRLAPSGDDDGAVSEENRQLVAAFVNDPTKFVGKHAKFSGIQQKGPFGDYAPASGAIQGILKGMYDAFTSDLETKNADQAMKQKQYEELSATKSAELATLQSTLANKKETLGMDTKTMTDSSVERDETQSQLNDDEVFFEETKSACKAKADEWAERSRLRTEELAVVNKAIEILTSDEAAATFGRATSMLLQTEKRAAVKNDRKHVAFRTLKAIAGKHHSLRMAAMAAMIQTATEGHFDVVITSVDKMLAELRQEEMDDITLRDYCQAEEVKVEGEIEDLQHEMDTLQGLLDRLNAKKQETQADITQTETDIAATEDAMAEALSNRNSENKDFKAALKDDIDAVALLASAIDAMTAFYKNNKLPLGLLAKKTHKDDPEYSVDPDKAPETFSAPYGGRSSEGGGITSIMGYIKEDLENEIKTSKAAEASAQKEFEEQKAAALKSVEALNQKKVTLEQLEADLDEQIADAEGEKEGKGTVKAQKKQYREDLKPKCDWMKEAFETRRDNRQEEMNGLMHAKASLAGGEEGGEEALVQRGSL